MPHGHVVCDKCLDSLHEDMFDKVLDRCPECGYPRVSEDYNCTWCAKNAGFKVFALSDYKAPFSRKLLEQYKFHKDRRISSVIAFLFDEKLSDFSEEGRKFILVPVPSSRTSLRKRGWDQMVEVCRVLKRRYGYEYLNILENRKKGEQQKKLSKEERERFSQDKYSIRKKELLDDVLKARIILVDDIVTTSNTLKACVKALQKAGFEDISALTWFAEL